MPAELLTTSIPPGRWIVGVSGGADSVALLRRVCASHPAVTPIVAHLDHESRGSDSAADAAFVRALADQLQVVCAVARRSEIALEATPSNLEAAYRAARYALFQRLVVDHAAEGVLVAHHADDRAETVLLRLLRGGEPAAIGGLRRESTISGVRILRPLLHVRRAALETYLGSIGQPRRVDASNHSDTFARNRVRKYLDDRPDLVEPLLRLADAADAARDWVRANASTVAAEELPAQTLADLPDVLARAAARDWLERQGSPRGELSIDVVNRLLAMARDRATPSPQTFPGNRPIARRGPLLVARVSNP